MISYTTKTGHYVLRDSEGRVVAKCAGHAIGEHKVNQAVDSEKSNDVESRDDLESVSVDEQYR